MLKDKYNKLILDYLLKENLYKEDILTSLKELDKFNGISYDKFFIDIKSGTGGLEAFDMVKMLKNMYINFFGNNSELVDCNEIDGGYNYCSILISNFLMSIAKCEEGIHKLIRPSPFNANNKRQTTFSSVQIYPYITKPKVTIKDSDIRFTNIKVGGPGGQHANKNATGAIITYLPTNITYKACSRSLQRSKDIAMTRLIADLNKPVDKTFNDTNISWGNHFRTYTLDDDRFKDKNLNYESSNVNNILKGDLNEIFYHSIISFVKKHLPNYKKNKKTFS